MGRQQVLSQEEKQKIKEMRLNGYLAREIAEKMYISKSLVFKYSPKGINNRNYKTKCKYV